MFDYDTTAEDRLLMAYRPPRRLCALVEGSIEGATTHYREEVARQRSGCMHRGDDKCVVEISFTKHRG